MKIFNHTYTLAFSVDTDRRPGAPVNPQEITIALLARINDLNDTGEWDEALGEPEETYENEPHD